jgi:propanediol dehydratase small subunit
MTVEYSHPASTVNSVTRSTFAINFHRSAPLTVFLDHVPREKIEEASSLVLDFSNRVNNTPILKL